MAQIETTEDDTYLSYREKISKAYFEIERQHDIMHYQLKNAMEYPFQLSDDESAEVELFLNQLHVLVHDDFSTFINMSEL